MHYLGIKHISHKHLNNLKIYNNKWKLPMESVLTKCNYIIAHFIKDMNKYSKVVIILQLKL